jgi:hypothetical protein
VLVRRLLDCLEDDRSRPQRRALHAGLAGSLGWFGVGFGGIVMGRIADRIGVPWTVMFGAVMIWKSVRIIEDLGGKLATVAEARHEGRHRARRACCSRLTLKKWELEPAGSGASGLR